MQIKRYEAATAREAMEKIKKDLGPDAVVLSTRKLRGGIEVVAARDTLALGLVHEETGGGDMLALFKSEMDQLKTLIRDFRRDGDIHVELAELKETVGALYDVLGIRRDGTIPPHLSKVYHHLLAVGVSKGRAGSLIQGVKAACPPDGDSRERDRRSLGLVVDAITRSVTPSYKRPRKKRLRAFVGPAGEGKTTTLAKVAARALCEEKRSVGVITTDTYRVGAAEQLKVYADIMEIPLEIASDRKDFERILGMFSDRDLILIDTPGKSRGDEKSLLRIQEYCPKDSPLEMNLVLSMTSSQERMLDAAAGFGCVEYDTIILTKLDDARKFGAMYNIVDSVGKPVSYIANGQNVPRDLREMDPRQLARLIVENRVH